MARWKASNENIQVLPSQRKLGSEGHKTGGGGLTSQRGLSRARYTNVVVYQTENLSLVIQTEAIARRKTGDEYVQLLPSSTHAARSTRGRSSVTVGSQQGRAGVVSNFRSF